MILQLGYILNSVPAWRKAFKLRVLVFVEYENEVAEEVMRVKALLDKLRIEAVTRVFWLASGELHTYETIVNGRSGDVDSEAMVNDILRDEDWWEELRYLRGRRDSMTASQEMDSLAAILDAPMGRPSTPNPRIDDIDLKKRRASMADLRDLRSKPSVSKLARLGVEVGIHTHHLGDDVFDDQIDRLDHLDSDGENSDIDPSHELSDSDLENSSPDAASDEEEEEATDPSRRPLLGSILRRRSFGDALRDHDSPKRRRYGPPSQRRELMSNTGEASSVSYGTLVAAAPPGQPSPYGSSSSRPPEGKAPTGGLESQDKLPPSSQSGGDKPPDPDKQSPASLQGVAEGVQGRPKQLPTERTRVRSPDRHPRLPRAVSDRPPTLVRGLDGDTLTDRRSQAGESSSSAHAPATLSRQSSAMRFTSKPLPETKTDVEGHSGPTIMFADPAPPSAPLFTERPSLSRQSSTGRFSSRLAMEPRLPKMPGEVDNSRVSFSEPLHHSRRGTARSELSLDQRINIPGLLDSYRSETTPDKNDDGSSYSTQSLSLSFNDLPSRAQHLILNELMRKNSADTAILFTTLPIPKDGTCLDENMTLKYLSDVEVLCNDLPPVLLILSNNMTVTVGL